MNPAPSATGIIPAQLSFLAIYCPSLGPTEETFADQVVFHYSRVAHEARLAAKKNARGEATRTDATRKEENENEKLRQIGLAQGMVDFARSFSNGAPVDSIETEKSRIVLQELEEGWWILASVELTRLPSITASHPGPAKKGVAAAEAQPSVEYSSREVSPPALLLRQLQQGHHVFTLHHGPSLRDLYTRLTRDKFCKTLDRYWSRFARSWNVLLHGNPAATVFGGIKLASGGELGIGVGEEEWGSGEREVFEDLARRTEGLVDIVVSRFGEPEPSHTSQPEVPETEAVPWLGAGCEPGAADGVIFGGVGTVTRTSLQNLSLWMRQIYTYGEYSYGVKDNPLRERRKRRRRNPPEDVGHSNGDPQGSNAKTRNDGSVGLRRELQQRELARQGDQDGGNAEDYFFKDPRPALHPRVASRDHATTPEQTPTPTIDPRRPNIPPPIVSAVEEALSKATEEVEQETERGREENSGPLEESGTTLGIPDQYMKYLTFGLSTLGKSTVKKRPLASRQVSIATTASHGTSTERGSRIASASAVDTAEDEEESALLTSLEPMPDGETLKSKIALQKRRETKGYFVVGLKGDLDAPIEELEDGMVTEGSLNNDTEGSRIVLRTVQVEVMPHTVVDEGDDQSSRRTLGRAVSNTADQRTKYFRRMRVLVYVHRPFMYCSLFEDRTSSLQYVSFYQSLHRNLSAIYKPLLSSTSAAKVAQRIEEAQATAATGDDRASISSTSRSSPKSSTPIFDLIYDPQLLTVHTSLPNIPDPGTLAAEGILSAGSRSGDAAPWTRIEALTVHSQILSTLASVANRKTDMERTSKTSRGWWIVWMRVPPSSTKASANKEVQDKTAEASDASLPTLSTYPSERTPRNPPRPSPMDKDNEPPRIAFLVRKAVDSPSFSSTTPRNVSGASTAAASSSRAMSSMLSHMTLGLTGSGWISAEAREDEVTGGVGAGWGPAALAGGIGIDARGYLEGLLSLGR